MSSQTPSRSLQEKDVPDGAGHRVGRIPKAVWTAFCDARNCAREFQRAADDFALEIADLRTCGITHHDLRWLICAGYIAHLQEAAPRVGLRRFLSRWDSLSFNERSCFVLTEAGERLAERIARGLSRSLPPRERVFAIDPRSPSAETPQWNAERHELLVRSRIVKRFKTPALNQEMILTVFEEEGWPTRIDDPLPPQADLDPRRRLHDTIKCLNRHQVNRLIRFRGDGTGEGVAWELVAGGFE